MRLLIAASLVAALHAAPAFAQVNDRWETHREVGDVAFLAANAVLGGVGAGLLQELRGGSFRDGFAAGALGGAISYGGRRIAAQHFSGAGFTGRQVSAIGSSIMRNSGARQPLLSHVVLPVGPLLVDVRRGERTTFGARVDISAAAAVAYALADDRVGLMWEESLSAGIPVFRAPHHQVFSDDQRLTGLHNGGIVLIGLDAATQQASVLAHERVHVVQADFLRDLLSTPAEHALLQRIPGGERLLRHAEVNIVADVVRNLMVRAFGWSWEERPWEIEAEFLEHR